MHATHTKRKESQMRLELKSGAVRLGPNQTLKVLDGAGSTVYALEGAVWITEENQPKDIVLQAGGCYRLRHLGVAIVNALGGEAAVSFA
jgi:hypothetical protein